MRDRETDSWWSIMTSSSIGGPLEDQDLVELPASEKTTWKDWRARHPETKVLSVGGVEHVTKNPYDNYFSNEETFRNLEVSDRRLPPKTPIFAFWVDGHAFAVPHSRFLGGKLLSSKKLGGRWLLVLRDDGAAIFESTRAFLVPSAEIRRGTDPKPLLPSTGAPLPDGYEAVTGFDTFWYNWVSVHPDTRLLK